VYLNLRFVAKKLKESLIERARIKKSFAKALKKEGLQSERLGRGHDSGPGQGYGGNGSERGSSHRGRGSGRGGGNVGGRPGGARGASRSSVIKSDGVRELVQLSRKTRSDGDPSKPTTATKSTATKTPAPKRTAVPESESDESELESGEERAPRPSKTQSRFTGTNADDHEEDDDGFFDDDDNVEGDMIDSQVSLRGNKAKGKGRADRADQDGATSMSEDEDEGNNVKRSRERSRAGPPPGDDDQDEDDEEVFLPYTNFNPNPSLRGRPGSTRGTSTSSRGRNHLQGSNQGPPASSSSSTPIYGAGRPRPWGTDGVASMSGSGSMGTATRPKGKKDKGNPNFTFLGRTGEDGGESRDREGRAGGLGGRNRIIREGQGMEVGQEVPPKAVVVNNTPFRGKPLHSHKPPGSTPSPTDQNSTTTTDNNNPRSTVTLRDLKRTAYLGPAKTSASSSAFGAGVHPGRTKRTLQKQAQTQHQAQAQQQQPGGRAGVVGGRRNAIGGGGSARQPRLGARMGALLQEIERRG
jgi:hypothetical protein